MRGLVADSVIRAARTRSTAPVGRVSDPEHPAAQDPLPVSTTDDDIACRYDDQSQPREAEREGRQMLDLGVAAAIIVMASAATWAGLAAIVWLLVP